MNRKPLCTPTVEMCRHAGPGKNANIYIHLDIATNPDPPHLMAKAETPIDQLPEDLQLSLINPTPLTHLIEELEWAAEELEKAEMALADAESRGESKCVIVCLMVAVAWCRKRLSAKRARLPRIQNWFLHRKT